MTGYAHTTYQASGMKFEPTTLRNFERIERMAREALDEAIVAECVAAGRCLDDAAADRLALARPRFYALPA